MTRTSRRPDAFSPMQDSTLLFDDVLTGLAAPGQQTRSEADLAGTFSYRHEAARALDIAAMPLSSSSTLPIGTINQFRNQLLNGYWDEGLFSRKRSFNMEDTGASAKGGVIHYNYSGFQNLIGYGSDANGIGAARKALVDHAFDYLGSVLDIDFQRTDSTSRDVVDIFFRDNRDGANAKANLDRFDGNGTAGHRWVEFGVINIAGDWFGGNSDLQQHTYQTIIHEILHVLGLGHAGNYNGEATFVTSTSHPDYGSNSNNFLNDSWQMSIMSYFDQTQNTALNSPYKTFVLTPTAADFAALASYYRIKAFEGNTVYGFNTNIEAANNHVIANLSTLASTNAFTIVDTGGIDTIDFSGYAVDQLIDLRVVTGNSTGFYSNVGGLNGNMSLAVGTVIENARSGAGLDTIHGNDVANEIEGGDGTDALFGYGGNDSFVYRDGQDGDQDVLIGGAGVDRILLRGAGTFNLTGIRPESLEGITFSDDGAVRKKAVFSSSVLTDPARFSTNLLVDGNLFNCSQDAIEIRMTGILLDISGWRFRDWNDSTDTLEIIGRTGQDIITGSVRGDMIAGNGGGDRIDGHDGNDVLLGGGGNDRLEGGRGNDQLYGGIGDDVLLGGLGDDQLFGGDNNDMLRGGGGSDQVYGEGGDDIVFWEPTGINSVRIHDGGSGFNTIHGDGNHFSSAVVFDLGAGTYDNGLGFVEVWRNFDDYLNTGTGHETVIGTSFGNILRTGSGNNRLMGRGGDDELHGGGGNDILDGGEGRDTLHGGDGDDILYGGFGFDTIYGGEGNDIVILRDGELPDNADGGNGTDILDYSATTFSNMIFNFVTETVRELLYHEDIAWIRSFEEFRDGSGNNTIHSSGFGKYFGNGGDDVMFARPGGLEIMDGGTGNDTVDFLAATAGMTFNMANGKTNNLLGSYRQFEQARMTQFDDTVTGTSGNDVIAGRNGNDTLKGGIGSDILRGGDGDDILEGGRGTDYIHGDAGADTIIIGDGDGIDHVDGGEGTDTLDISASTLGGLTFDFMAGLITGPFTGGPRTMVNIEALLDGSGSNTVVASGNLWTYEGRGGDDTVIVMQASPVRTFNGGEGTDMLDLSALSTAYVFNMSSGVTQFFFTRFYNFENALMGSGNDDVTGNGAANVIHGGAGNDILRGGGGDDTLQGGVGTDTLTGGGGKDTFLYMSVDEFGDTITDFSSFNLLTGNDDRFAFSASIFVEEMPLGVIVASQFQRSDADVALTADVRFLYETDTGLLRFDADGNGAGAAMIVATLGLNLSMTHNDFWIV